MCNLYSITTNQAAIIALFRAINRYVGNLPPMTGVFPDNKHPAMERGELFRKITIPAASVPVIEKSRPRGARGRDYCVT